MPLETIPYSDAEAWDSAFYHLGAVRALAAAYEAEHDWDSDEDPEAARECLGEARCLYEALVDELGPRPEEPLALPPDDRDIPF
jgi:hypothetical protein